VSGSILIVVSRGRENDALGSYGEAWGLLAFMSGSILFMGKQAEPLRPGQNCSTRPTSGYWAGFPGVWVAIVFWGVDAYNSSLEGLEGG